MPSFSLRAHLVGAASVAFPVCAAAAAAKLPELSPNGEDVRFGRVYETQHLQAHPNQKMQRIFVRSRDSSDIRKSFDRIEQDRFQSPGEDER